jgi:hypothetical protein
MSTDSPAVPDGTKQRPRTVDYALIAIGLQCLFTVTAAFALRGARTWVIDNWHKHNTYPGETDAQLHKHFESITNGSLIGALFIAIAVLAVAKFIRDGKNPARWLYLVVAIIPIPPLGFLWNISNFVVNIPTAYRLLSGMAGLVTLFALILLFMRQSSAFFRKPGARTFSIADLIRPRRVGVPDEAKPAVNSGKAQTAQVAAQDSVSARPRAKSRKNPVE